MTMINKLILFFTTFFILSCTKQQDCKPITCKVTQWDYTVCWSPDNSHQYVLFDEPEVQYIDTDECEFEQVFKPMFEHNDTLGIWKYPSKVQTDIKNKPTKCDCY